MHIMPGKGSVEKILHIYELICLSVVRLFIAHFVYKSLEAFAGRRVHYLLPQAVTYFTGCFVICAGRLPDRILFGIQRVQIG